MSITYGHDLIDGDKHLESTVRAYKAMRPLILPGGALVNHFPFCANSDFIPPPLVVPNSYFSTAHSFMGTMPQSRTIGTNS
jgi:hypothetical protein